MNAPLFSFLFIPLPLYIPFYYSPILSTFISLDLQVVVFFSLYFFVFYSSITTSTNKDVTA